MIRSLGMLGLLVALALVACDRAAPAAPTEVSSALASPSPAASPTAPSTPTTIQLAASPSSLPPTPRPTEKVPAGLSGAIAYVDTTCALVTLDLAAGDRRARPLPPTETALDAPPCIIDEAAARAWAGAPTVTPASAALPQGGLRARSGEEAWVDPFTEDALLHIRDPATDNERTYPLNPSGPSDHSYGLLDYVAGDEWLLAEWSPMSSSAMLFGGSLFLLDPHTGEQQELGVVAHHRPETIALNPAADDLVAIIPSSVRVAELPLDCGLLVLDAAAAAMRCLTGEPASTPLWSPDGATLAYATGGAIALAATSDLAAPPLMVSAGGAQTGLLAWLSPTQLLYLTYPAPPARLRGELYVLDTSTGQHVLIAHDVGEPRCYPVCMYRSLVIVYRP